MGNEPYFIDTIADYIINNVLDESEKAFNQSVLYGRDIDINAIIETSKRFPMMANHQVVVVKEAQNVKGIEQLASYIAEPLNTTLLVICYKNKTIDKRKKDGKKLIEAITNSGILFESKTLYDNQVPNWISNYLKKEKVTIDPRSALLLTEFLGTDLSKIANELNKLLLNLPSDASITPQIIEQNIGISKDFNNFELQNALGKRQVAKAFQIVDYFSKNPKSHPFVVTISSLYSFFSKLLVFQFLSDKSKNNAAAALKINPYFVGDYQNAAQIYTIPQTVKAITYLREYDLKSKGLGSTGNIKDSELLKELIYKLLHS